MDSVVVSEPEMFHYTVPVAEICVQGSVIGYSGEQYSPVRVDISVVSFRKDRLKLVIVYCAEQKRAFDSEILFPFVL